MGVDDADPLPTDQAPQRADGAEIPRAAHADAYDLQAASDKLGRLLFEGHVRLSVQAPAEAEEQARWLAYIGRAAWQPVSAWAAMPELARAPGT